MSYSNFYNFREINKALESLTTRVTNVEGKIIRDGLTVNTLNVDTSLNLTGDTVISGDVTIDNSNGLQVKSGMSVFNNTLTVDTLLKTFFGSSVDADEYYIKKVASGGAHTAVIITNGVKSFLFTFGENNQGQLGTGNTNIYNTPQHIDLGGGIITDVECGEAYTAMIVDGELYVCGSNAFGQLGMGSVDRILTPDRVIIPGAVSVIKVACGGNHTVVIYKKTDNKNYAVSMGKCGDGQLGQNTTISQVNTPNPVVDVNNIELSGINNIACGYDFTLFVVDNSTGSGDKLYGCGNNDSGQLGTGELLNGIVNNDTTSYEYAHHILTNTNGITNIQAGDDFTYIVQDGLLYSAGNNDSFKLARTLTEGEVFSSVFTETSIIPSTYTNVSCGSKHVAAFDNYTVKLVGLKSDGRIGLPDICTNIVSTITRNFVNPNVTEFNMVSCGKRHTMIVFDRLVLCGFGNYNSGQLGNGNGNGNASEVSEKYTHIPQFVSATEIAENANVNVTGNLAINGSTTIKGSLHLNVFNQDTPINITHKLEDIIDQLGKITTRLDALEAFHP